MQIPLQKMTILDFLKDRATRNSGDIAFRFMGNGDLDGPITEWTFSELYRQSLGVAADLFEQGLSDSNILLAFPPGLDFVKSFFGCMLAGARAVPVPLPNPRSRNPLGRILNTASSCGASIVLTTNEIATMVEPMIPDLPIRLAAVTDKAIGDWDGPKSEMNEVAYLQFTSGSTGHPKGVAVKHANAVANVRMMGEMLSLNSSKPALVWAPHYHDLCLVCFILGPIYYGYESTLMSPMDFLLKPARWLQAMSRYKVANTACPNFGYEYAVRRVTPEQCEGLDLSNWIVAGSGGEPVLSSTMNAFNKKFGAYGFKPQAFTPTFGMAESVLFVSASKSFSSLPNILRLSTEDLELHTVRVLPENEPNGKDVVSCGKPGSGHRVIVVDPTTMTQVRPDQIGELWIQGPSVPDGYWGLPEESAATYGAHLADTNEGPFLRTGDLGFVANGEVYLTGRLKEMIIIAGRNHYPADIELTVHKSGAPVRAGACAAISVLSDGVEELVIIAEADEKKTPGEKKSDPEPNQDKGNETIEEFWASASKSIVGAVSSGHGLSVRSIVFVKPRALEKTSSGKLRRRFYQKLYVEGKLDTLHEKKFPKAL